MERFIRLFGHDCIDCLVADREFIGKEWIGWLNDNRIRYYLFGHDCIDCLVADCEFIGKEWIGWLNDNRIRYYIRIRQDFWVVKPSTGERIRTWWLFNSIKVGQEKFYYKLFLHKGQYVYLAGSRIKNSDGIPELQILICFNRPEDGVATYKNAGRLKRHSVP